jgi:hypothetical protein
LSLSQDLSYSVDAKYIQLTGLMKNAHLILLSAFGMLLVGIFWWGFYGYVASGSGGPPPKTQSNALLIGGIGYLALLFFSLMFLLGAEGGTNQAFGQRVWKNLRGTVIALLCCIPAAFFVIGFLAPPFILTGSACALMASAFMGPKRAPMGR